MYKIPSHPALHLMKYSAIRINMGNTMSILVHEEGIATRGKILKRFGLDLIKSDLWFHILNFVSQRNL